MEIENLVKKKDGATLLELAIKGDHFAGLSFANLVFSGNYKGSLVGEKGESLTQKYAKEKAIKDAINVLTLGAEDNYLDSILRISDMYFFGVMEDGPFGSKLVACNFKNATLFFNKVIEHDKATSDMLGMAEFRLGLLCKLIKSPVTKENMEKAICHWERARLQTGPGFILATATIAEYEYNDKQDYDIAIPLLKSIYQEHLNSALWLALAYKNGNGVNKSDEKYNSFYDLWASDSGKRKKKK